MSYEDEETSAILYEGISALQLSRVFGLHTDTVKRRLEGLDPVGKRRGQPIWNLAEAAQYMVSPKIDIDEFIKKLSVADLPTPLRKEFWAAQRSRQLFEKQAAELWYTNDVLEVVTKLFSTLRQSLLISREVVERETELTAKQRKIITQLIDSALEEVHAEILRKFSDDSGTAGGGSTEVQPSDTDGDEDL